MKKVVTFGEVMLRLSTPGHERFNQAQHFDATYAGAEANVAVSVASFGLPAEHVTVFPDNDLGKAAVQSLKRFEVVTDNIQFGLGRMGVYFLENGAVHRASRIIYDRFDSAFALLDPASLDWKNILKEAAWFHWTGITPAISQNAADACLEAIQIAHE
jgi:2-dehydro-3-deoxygluconokinase